VLLKGASAEARIAFKDKGNSVKWEELTGLPDAWKQGLPPGKYTLKAETELGPQTVTFHVELDTVRLATLKRADSLAALLGADDPLVPLVRTEAILYRTATDRSPPYLADALDYLQSLPDYRRSPYLTKLRDSVERRLLEPDRVAQPLPADRPTGEKAIDEVRGLLAAGQWGRALNRLDALETETGGSVRTQAFAVLYRGVALSESGFKGEEDAGDCFRSAIIRLGANGTAEDRFRAHVNYAGYQSNRALDRLHNQSFQAAAGVAHPLTSALAAWSEAADHYGRALDLAGKLEKSDLAGVHVNLARLYAILADTLLGLKNADNEKALLPAIEGARYTAATHARFVTESKEADPAVRALAESILGQLALRSAELAACRKHAERARQIYLEAGSLPGVESAHRLMGLAFRNDKGAEARKNALRHLQVSWELGELLRERYPSGKAGANRAGFFARRAPVADQLVELLLEDGRPAEALAYVEQARARSLQDLLIAAAIPESAAPSTRELSAVLKNWPKDAVALEYYLGTEKAWVFVVDSPGRVRAFPLVGLKGEAIPPAQIIQLIRRFIREIDHLLDRERSRVLARKYDHSWQEDLHDLYRILIPVEAAIALKKSKIAVVIPQHLLHYLPFPALVTEPDRGRDSSEVPRPKFLIEEPVAIVQVPSLTVWDRLRQSPAAQIQEVRAIGDADNSGLPGVAQDLANLKAAFGSRIKASYTGTAAHEANAKAILAAKGLAFFGSHGQDRPDQPLDGQLIFEAPSPGNEDGFLTAAEVYSKPVLADLIVMSACYSGRADRSPLPGDDLFGLQRAFLQSGAKTVVAGLWDVYDGKAPELMNGVFQRLSKGESTAEALAGSQREFIKKYRDLPEPRRYFTHPYFWAVYSVWGDDRTTVKP
jgi:CHAT domain-containing protein